MRHKDANQLKYKITLPLIMLLSLAAAAFFHNIIIDQRGYNDVQAKLNGIKLNAYDTMNSETGTDYDFHRMQTFLEELEKYPKNQRFYKDLHHENTDLFNRALNFIAAAQSKNTEKMTIALKRLDEALSMALNDIYQTYKSDANRKIKIEYAILFMICLLVGIHFFFVDNPMKEELIRNAREKEVSKSTIQKLAERDTLTNLPGRMKFYEESDREVAAATRYGADLVLIKMDIHKFKDINRAHGQKAGDKLLASFARTIRKNLRRPDSFYRVGGDKFIILAPHTSIKNARNLVEKISRLIESNKNTGNISFDVNIGIAACTPDDNAETLLKKVDSALHESKKEGAGAVFFYPEPTQTLTEN